VQSGILMSHHMWTPAETSDVSGPGSNLRTYLEQRDVRRCLTMAAGERPIKRAIDVGCGYGRLTMVLAEFAPAVTGVERESGLVAEARRLLPAIEFVEVASLANLPKASGSCDFIMTFTVVQHMHDPGARAVLAEMKRIAAGAFVLLTEETDASFRDGDLENERGGVTIGRAIETYQDWMIPFELVLQFPRQIEPGYLRKDVGSYMLFRGPR
jgi:SAM-dependent methyltransferase